MDQIGWYQELKQLIHETQNQWHHDYDDIVSFHKSFELRYLLNTAAAREVYVLRMVVAGKVSGIYEYDQILTIK